MKICLNDIHPKFDLSSAQVIQLPVSAKRIRFTWLLKNKEHFCAGRKISVIICTIMMYA